MIHTTLIPQNLARQAWRCSRCGACLAVCPSFKATGDESRGARGRMALAEAVESGDLGLTKGLGERYFSCLGCRACAEACPAGLDPLRLIQAMKEILTTTAGQKKALRAVARRVTEARLPAGLPPEFSAARTRTSRVVFFPGCATSLFTPGTGRAAVNAMNAAGADVITPRGLQCCGMPLISLGESDSAREMARVNMRLIQCIEADHVVTACPACALGLKEEMPRLLGGSGQARRVSDMVQDIHQFLAGRASETIHAIRPGPAADASRPAVTVTWHDPCHLRHGLEVAGEPREIIAALPGVEYVETNGDISCCGAGGVFRLHHRDLSLKIGRAKAEEIAASGAEIVATGCPACRIHLKEVLTRAKANIKVVHTVDLLGGGLFRKET